MSTPTPVFLDFSAEVGSKPEWVQGAGGNTSEKDGKIIWVKASGALLSEARAGATFLPLCLDTLRSNFELGIEDARSARLDPTSSLRPSIESALHAVLPHRVVVHTHAVDVIAHAARRDAQAILARKLDGLDWAFVPYARPGLPLAVAMQKASANLPHIYILANHGVVVGSDNVEGAAALLRAVGQRLASDILSFPSPSIDRLREVAAGTEWVLPMFEESHALAFSPVRERVCAGALYPDHVVFLGPGAVPTVPNEQLPEFLRASPPPYPAMVVSPDLGVLLRKDATKGAHEMARCLALVSLRVDQSAELAYLGVEQERELLSWDAETYRQALERARSRN